MNINTHWLSILILTILFMGCKKSDFLDKKPITNIVTPKTLKSFQGILENNLMIMGGIGLSQMASDDYTITYTNWNALDDPIQRNSYIWAKDIYQGTKGPLDWDQAYTKIFYANSVLDGLSTSDSAATVNGQYLKGWALFVRAYAFYDLVRTYCKAYDAGTATTDLGIPLRLKSGIDYIVPRSNLQQSIDQILGDLKIAENLLPSVRPSANLNRPSKIAVYALLARINLDMRDYTQAENDADKCLALYSTLIDYNLVDKTVATPFSTFNDELIFNSVQAIGYYYLTAASPYASGRVEMGLINQYDEEDLRLPIYYQKLVDGTYAKKQGYFGSGSYPFMGLATDEVYLIKAECLARRGATSASMDKLNQLLVKRFSNEKTYKPITATTPGIALSFILKERRKELVWRGLRWQDLKRLNKEGANITLIRTLNSLTYSLPPNDNRWVFPIYPDEVALSGIQQNPR